MFNDRFFKTTLKKPDGRSLYLYSRNPISSTIVPTNPIHDPIHPKPELRWHPLRSEWVIYASHRQDRTFLPPKNYSPLAVTHSPDFPTEMPAGNYEVAVFDNLFPSLSLNLNASEVPEMWIQTEPAKGKCEVVVFTQDPETNLGDLPEDRIKMILEVLADRTEALRCESEVKYVLPFENRGVEQGVTIHHPHGQLYAYHHIPPLPKQMLDSMKAHYEKHGENLFQKIIEEEKKDGRRIVAERENAIAFIPAFARYPYETWIAPKRRVDYLSELNSEELLDLSKVLKEILMKFDRLWSKPFPYLLLLFQAPLEAGKYPEFHLHFQIYPPYRTQDRLKYLAGTELGAGVFVNDSYPEEKAKELKAVQIQADEWK